MMIYIDNDDDDDYDDFCSIVDNDNNKMWFLLFNLYFEIKGPSLLNLTQF